MSSSQNNPFGLENVYNFRSLSWHALQQTILYRSANLTSATVKDKDIICNKAGCRTYIDLRSENIPEHTWNRTWGGRLKRYHCSISENLTPMVDTTIPEVREFFNTNFPLNSRGERALPGAAAAPTATTATLATRL